MLVIFFRAIIIFATLIVIMRLMGKRQIGEMQPFEFIITLLIAELLLAVFIGFFVKSQIEHPANNPHKEESKPSSEPTE